MPKERKKIKQEIIKIVSVPPKREGGTGYLKLTDEEIDKIVELFKRVVQRFMKRVVEKEMKEHSFLGVLVGDEFDCLYLDIQKRAKQWLKDNF